MASSWLLLASAALALAQAGESPCGPGDQCVPLTRCPAALQALRGRPPRRPKHCGFADSSTFVPDVCCGRDADRDQGADKEDQPPDCPAPAPPLDLGATPTLSCERLSESPPVTGGREPGDLARRMCRKHQEDLCALPAKAPFEERTGFAAFGVSTDILEYPHMALVGYGERDNLQYACGGSLIAPNFILTAAHCAKLSGQPASWVLLGSTNRTSREPKANDTHQLIQVAEVIVHPEYLATLKYHDIALLRLDRPARLKAEEVYPACLNTDIDVDSTGADAVATGWGATGFLEDASPSLIKVTLNVRNLQYCRDNVDLEVEKVPRGLLDDTQMCAGGGVDKQDTCQGDSGGPLQTRANPFASKPCIYRIIGVISFGPPCGLGKPGVYTKVAAYVPWIESIVWPTKEDGCGSNAHIVYEDEEVRVANTGPGSIARGMCRAYHVAFCRDYLGNLKNADLKGVKPSLHRDNACHHNNCQHSGERALERTTVTLRYGDSLINYQSDCAGALVAPDTVLTAGRCAALGCFPLTHVTLKLSPNKCGEAPICGKVLVEVAKVVVHPDYRPGRAYADLAVVKLAKSLDLHHFFPLCLNTVSDVAVRPGVRANAEGWNIRGAWENGEYGLPFNNTVTVRDPQRCSAALLGSDRLRRALPEGYRPSLLCAGGLCDNETYAGDSGTPLTALKHYLDTRNGRYFVVYALGVASSLTYCTARDAHGRRLPDLFADVAQHIGWIERTVWPDQ